MLYVTQFTTSQILTMRDVKTNETVQANGNLLSQILTMRDVKNESEFIFRGLDESDINYEGCKATWLVLLRW